MPGGHRSSTPVVIILVTIPFILSIQTAIAGDLCYFPNWQPFHENYDFCDNTPTCCRRTGLPPWSEKVEHETWTAEECPANGLCAERYVMDGVPGVRYVRKLCAGQDWERLECLKGCGFEENKKSEWMTPCDRTDTGEKWCCGNTTECCGPDWKGEVHYLPQTLPQTVGIDDGASSAVGTSMATSGGEERPRFTSTTSTDSANSAETVEPTAGAGPGERPEDKGDVSRWSYEAIVGIAVGLPGSIAAILAVLFAVYQHKNKKKEAHTTPPRPTSPRPPISQAVIINSHCASGDLSTSVSSTGEAEEQP